jgi:hypothetical protein
MTDIHDPMNDDAAVSPPAETLHETLDLVRSEVDRLAHLDPAEAVAPAAKVADVLGRLLDEVRS